MIFGYHTSGLQDLAPRRAVELLDEAGFGSIALPVGGRLFDPRQSGCWERVEELAQTLRERNLASIVEVEPSHKMPDGDEPGGAWSLISPDPDRRQSYIKLCEHAIDTAATLRSDCVVLYSGALVPENAGQEGGDPEQETWPDPDVAWAYLSESVSELLEYAEERGVPLGLEPAIGMLVDTTDAFNRLLGRVSSSMLRLSLDIASLFFSGETPLAHFLHAWSGRLVNLHLCDVKPSVGSHRLLLGEGEIDFPPLFHVLDETGYSGGIHVRFDGPIIGNGTVQMVQTMHFLRKAARLHL